MYRDGTGASCKPHLKLVKCVRAFDELPPIRSMSYKADSEELFLADEPSPKVRTINMHANQGSREMPIVYENNSNENNMRGFHNVCHINDPETLLVCWSESNTNNYWLAALRRSRDEGEGKWREKKRLRIENTIIYWIDCFALSKSRVLIGEHNSKYMELFRIHSNDPIIKSANRIEVPEEYNYFSARDGSEGEVLVAMSYKNMIVKVHLLDSNKLKTVASILMYQYPNIRGYQHKKDKPGRLLWVGSSRLLVMCKRHVVILNYSCVGNKHKLEKTIDVDFLKVVKWCALDDGLVIYDSSGIQQYIIS